MKKDLIIMCGLPCSGKSHFAKNSLKTLDAEYISSDYFIEEFAALNRKTYNEVFQSYIKSAETQCRTLFLHALSEKNNIIVDRTNLTPKSRGSWISGINKSEYKITCVSFSMLSVEQVMQNQAFANRSGKHIPEYVIKSMINTYVAPSKEEGFDEIIEMNSYIQLEK